MGTPLIIVGLLVAPYVVTRLSDVSATRREWAGVVEIVCALALLVPGLRHRTGWLLIWMLLLLLPINVYAALYRVPMGGHAWGPIYLWIRIPLQLFLMAWTYRFATQPAARKPRGDADE